MDEQESKRDRVRRMLINPLLRAGLRKQPAMKSDAYAEMLVRLSDKLSHLSDQNLSGMEDWITRRARGKDRNQWPDEVSIVSKAHDLQSPPPRKCPYVVSVMQSRAGELAKEMGYHAELLLAARRYGPPFSKMDLSKIAGEAQKNRQEAERVREMLGRNTAPEERRQWLSWYLRHQQEAVAIIESKRQEGQAA